MPSACLSVSGEGTGRVRARASVLGRAGRSPDHHSSGAGSPPRSGSPPETPALPIPSAPSRRWRKPPPGGPTCKQGLVPSLPGPKQPHVGQTGSPEPAPLRLDGRGPARPLQRGPRRALAARTAEEARPGPAGWERPVTASAAISRPRTRSSPEGLRALPRHGRRRKWQMARAEPAGCRSAAERPSWVRTAPAGLRLPAAPAGGQSARAGRKCVRRRGRLVRRGRGEAALVSAGALGGPRGPCCAPPAVTGSFPYPSLFPEPSAAASPRLCPLPSPAPPGPHRGAAPALPRCLGPAWPRARLVRSSRGRSGSAPAAPRGGPGPGQALAPPRGPRAGWACPALSRSHLCFAVVFADCFSFSFPEIPVLCPRFWAEPLGFPAPRRSVPELPSRCPGLRVLLRLGRRWRGPAA